MIFPALIAVARRSRRRCRSFSCPCQVFDTAFVTLFHVTGGDPWPETLPSYNEDGSVNWLVMGFIFGYTIIVIWVILQVCAWQSLLAMFITIRRAVGMLAAPGRGLRWAVAATE